MTPRSWREIIQDVADAQGWETVPSPVPDLVEYTRTDATNQKFFIVILYRADDPEGRVRQVVRRIQGQEAQRVGGGRNGALHWLDLWGDGSE